MTPPMRDILPFCRGCSQNILRPTNRALGDIVYKQFGNVRYNSAVPNTFAKFVKTMNYTRRLDAKLT